MERLKRIPSIDILRGLVMVLMALDHTRDYFHEGAMTADPLDPGSTSVLLFLTRYITHFCAPIFVFLSGLSVYLSAQNKIPQEATSFLVKRGAWLILVEIVIVTLALTFNPLYNFIILQVIWVIGWSMILLAVLRRVSYLVVLAIGLILVGGHNITDVIALPQTGAASIWLKVLLTASGTVLPLNETHFVGVFYAILPWTGIMFLGYAAGAWYHRDFVPAKRKKYLLWCGFVLLLLFAVLRLNNGYGDPSIWKNYPHGWQTFLSFLNISKYPASLMYACITIGTAMLLLYVLENAENSLTRVLAVYGAVPFFYYILHFYLLHTLLVFIFFATGRHVTEIVQMPFLFRPAIFGFGLAIVYLIWMLVVAVLYRPCLWFKEYKATHQQWWLKYL